MCNKTHLDGEVKSIKWTYLREMVTKSDATQLQTVHCRISTGINKPRHVFAFIIDAANDGAQTANKFLYNTFAVDTDKTLTSCYLEVGNGNEYPRVHYKPTEEPTRVFRDVLKYVHVNNEYATDTLLNRSNFGTIFPFIYFDLTKQPLDIRDGMTSLTLSTTLSAAATNDYVIYSLVLHEQDVEIRKIDEKLILRSM